MSAVEGKVVAVVSRGTEADRAIAVTLAEAGADLALGTVSRRQAEEFGTASIANEVWAIGREQFNAVVDATDPAAAAAFAAEVLDRLGRCDAVIIASGLPQPVEFDELSRDEWDEMAAEGLTAPLMVAQAFGRLLERGGGGRIIFVIESAPFGDVAAAVVCEAQRAMAANIGMNWSGRGVRILAVGRDGAPEHILHALS
jgi:NAD(P)-dependent dehydrogenase (short-subunit alcohol dehydrogenase family)